MKEFVLTVMRHLQLLIISVLIDDDQQFWNHLANETESEKKPFDLCLLYDYLQNCQLKTKLSDILFKVQIFLVRMDMLFSKILQNIIKEQVWYLNTKTHPNML